MIRKINHSHIYTQFYFTPKLKELFIMTTNMFINTDQRIVKNLLKSKVKMSDFGHLLKVKAGKYGKVYKAEYKKTNKIYALKMVPIKYKDIIEQGFTVSSILNHENIMKTYGYFIHAAENGKDYIVSVLEYVNGVNLMTYYTDNNNRTINQNLPTIILQILDGLKYLCENEIVHRDLKLENIVITRDCKVKIVDNDFAITNDKIVPNDVCGTLYYIPPEVFKNKGYNTQFDMWSLGIIIYYLLTGQYPFDGDDRQDLEDAILNTNAYIDDLPILYQRLLRGLFQRNPELRLTPEIAIDLVKKF